MKKKKMIFAISLLSAAAAAGIFYIYGAGIKGGIYALAAVCMIIIAAEDAMTRQIHDVLLLAIALLGFADYYIELYSVCSVNSAICRDMLQGLRNVVILSGLPGRTAGAFCVSLPMMLTNIISRRLTGKDSFGSGDVILCAVCGLLLGAERTLLACAVAFISAGIYAAFLLFGRKASGQDVFAFGPFISIGFLFEMVQQGLL